jgi:O-succinylhomoserine sulfhydrylase
MDLRVRAQSTTAAALAEALDGHPKLARLIYPGHASHPQNDLVMRQMGNGGTMLSMDVKGGKEAAFRALNALKIALISNNLGDAKTIATPPAATTHQRLPDDQKQLLGITPGLIRLSLGIEDSQDVIADILQALEHA